MAHHTKIEWCDATWNPVRGCTTVSEGCRNCFAMRDAARKNSNPKTPGYWGFAEFDSNRKPHWTGEVSLIPEMLCRPLHWKRSMGIFVNSMSDLFHSALPDQDIAEVFRAMDRADWHTYMILTKRAERMAELWPRLQTTFRTGHVWPGISAEDNATFERRAFELRKCKAAIRFVSLEPLLGPVNLRLKSFPNGDIDWVIAGGETGPGARPVEYEWIRHIQAQCEETGTAFFFKGWGDWLPAGQDGAVLADAAQAINCSDAPIRVGKRAAGRLLDGREWLQFPEVQS